MWADPDVRKLRESEQRLYLLLLTHDLTFAGVADWRPARLAGFAVDSTAESIREAAHGLARASFVIIDEDTEEIMLRSFLRHDGLLRQPKVSVSMANAYATTASSTIRGVLIHELHRLRKDYPEWVAWTLPQVQKILAHDAIDPKTLDVPDDPHLGVDLPLGLGAALPVDLGVELPLALPDDKGSAKGLPTPAPAPSPYIHRHSEAPDAQGNAPGPAAGKPSMYEHGGFDSIKSRPDVKMLCDQLADRIEANGSRRPNITKTWLDECRRLVDLDEVDPSKAANLIDWCQRNGFWKSNILSMAKFRKHYDQLRLAALADWEKNRNGPASDGGIDVDAVLGKDYWMPGTPPADLTIEGEIGWKKSQRAAHLAERLVEARSKLGAP
ncbi:hypothetical protein AAGW05_06145 [Arthrobacter sp. LAPM80]|uniref:hypothetical protein n=1 Tax=Arthrobacter sp. LAPM80 TaxID=3141788 RepID=UPI00398ACC38